MSPTDAPPSPFTQLGGRTAVLKLSERFYDIMEEFEPELARAHALDPQGRIHRGTRERFGLFLVGWLGGPDDYVQRHGHPRLRMRHAKVAVTIAQRDAWLRCMNSALAEVAMPNSTLDFLRQRFAEVADFLRNVEEST